MLNTTHTATTTALAMIRNPATTLEQVAASFACTVDYAAGLIDAVMGDGYFADGCIDWCDADEAIKAEYRAGFATGTMLAEQEANADAWTDCYATAAAEACQAAELVPACCDDCPF